MNDRAYRLTNVDEGEIDLSEKRYKVTDVFRAFACVFDYLYLLDEMTCVNGTAVLMDVGGFSMKLNTTVSLEDRKDFIQTWQVTADVL